MVRHRTIASFLCLVLLLPSSPAFCQAKAQATGHFYYTCVIGNQLDIQLTMPGDRTAEFHFLLRPSKDATKAPFTVQAEFCSSPKHCEHGEATVWFRHLSRKKASGRFTIEFTDGRKEEGAFEAPTKNNQISSSASDPIGSGVCLHFAKVRRRPAKYMRRRYCKRVSQSVSLSVMRVERLRLLLKD